MTDDENSEYQIAQRELERAIDALRVFGGKAPIYVSGNKPGVAAARVDVPSELEHRALALCEGEHVAFPLVNEMLERWFDRSIPPSELRMVLERLATLGLIECQLGDSWASGNVVPEIPAILRTKFRATPKGMEYLKGSSNQDA